MTTFRDVQTDVSAVAYAVAMVIAAVMANRGSRPALAVLALLAFAWLGIDRLWEGPVLYTFNVHHGVTSADPVGVAGLAFAGWVLLRDRRR